MTKELPSIDRIEAGKDHTLRIKFRREFADDQEPAKWKHARFECRGDRVPGHGS